MLHIPVAQFHNSQETGGEGSRQLIYFGGGGGALRTADGVDGTPFTTDRAPGGAAGARLLGCPPLPLTDTRPRAAVVPSTSPCRWHPRNAIARFVTQLKMTDWFQTVFVTWHLEVTIMYVISPFHLPWLTALAGQSARGSQGGAPHIPCS